MADELEPEPAVPDEPDDSDQLELLSMSMAQFDSEDGSQFDPDGDYEEEPEGDFSSSSPPPTELDQDEATPRLQSHMPPIPQAAKDAACARPCRARSLAVLCSSDNRGGIKRRNKKIRKRRSQ